MPGNRSPIAKFTVRYSFKTMFQTHPVLFCGDIEKAFLQIRLPESERNVLRFHWVKNSDPSVIKINRFTRLVLSLIQSPFILEGTLKEHFQYYINEYPTHTENISEDKYVEGLLSGSNTTQRKLKSSNKNPLCFFEKANLICISGAPIYRYSNTKSESELTYAKENFKSTADLAKILGAP